MRDALPHGRLRVFFAVVFLGHWLLNPKPLPWKLFMIGASYVFYAWWNIHFIWLLAASRTIAQLGAMAVARQQDEPARRAWTMAIAVALTLAPLAYFKYYGFFSLNVTEAANSLGLRADPPLIQVILPVGVSFFSFMAVSYIVDVYRGHTTVASWIDVFLYLSFFPHLVAGPIVRPNELIPQLDVRRDPRHVDVGGAAWLIFGGLFKKVVISSFLAIGDRRSGVRRSRASRRDRGAVRDLGIRDRDLRRLQRLHRHRDRRGQAPRLPVPAELRPALQRPVAAGLLAPVAHDARRDGCATTSTSRSAVRRRASAART